MPAFCAVPLWEAQKDIIACNCATKMVPSSPTARYKSDAVPAGIPVYTTEEKAKGDDRIEKVWRIGTGIMLISKKVLHALKGKPLFEVLWNEATNYYEGEDWRMLDLAEEAGFDVWIDHLVSASVGHVGDMTYGHDTVVCGGLVTSEIPDPG